MKEVRRALESEIAAKNGEIEDLRRKMSAMGSGGQIGDGISATADIPARAPSVASLGPSGTGSVKSIWSSSDNGFVLFSHDVPREVCSSLPSMFVSYLIHIDLLKIANRP